MKVIADLRTPQGGRRRFELDVIDDGRLVKKVAKTTGVFEDLLRDDRLFREAMLDALKKNGMSEEDGKTDIQLYVHLPIKLWRVE